MDKVKEFEARIKSIVDTTNFDTARVVVFAMIDGAYYSGGITLEQYKELRINMCHYLDIEY